MPPEPLFLFVTCQVGAEPAVKREIAVAWPAFRLAFSRPGFLTFKLPSPPPGEDFELGSVFARAYGFSLGKITAESVGGMAAAAWPLAKGLTVQRIHAWGRDLAAPGHRGYEPGPTPEAVAAAKALAAACPTPHALAAGAADRGAPARTGQMILDCVAVDPGVWWLGYHRAKDFASRWPGGLTGLELPPEAVSRAWLKMEEALQWSQLPIARGARCVELGSAPGGASQALLMRGCEVIGVDPAEMHPTVAAHPAFTHLRRRAAEVRRRDLRKCRWLTADMNVAPQYTLDAVEGIVTHPEINIRGILLTLKLFEWKLAQRLPECLERVRGWGFNIVRARQLRFNHREVTVMALQRPFVRKPLFKASRPARS